MQNNSRQILISPLFLLGLFILLLNDFVLKAQFHNFLTGKLSDFAGLFIFPLFWSAFFPKRKFTIYVCTAILFVFWKSAHSQFLINFWNSLEIFRIARVNDFSDLFALSVLPISYFYLAAVSQNAEKFRLQVSSSFTQTVKVGFVCLFSLFAFTATSYEQDRSVWIQKKYEFAVSVNDFEKIMRDEKSFVVDKFQRETDVFPANQYLNSKVDPSSYYVFFDLKKPYCESRDIRIFLSFNVQEEKIIVNTASFRYWCEQPPTDRDKKELTAIFEREVIEKIRQNNTQ